MAAGAFVMALNANVMGPTGAPLQDGTVLVQLTAPSGKSDQVRLSPPAEDAEWGLFTGAFTPSENGLYHLVMTCRENGSTLETDVSVQGAAREKIGDPANLEVMQEIASITRGKMVGFHQIDEVFDAIEQLPEPEPEVRRIRIWSHPAWGATLICLLGVFWVGRKLRGTI